MEQGIDGIEVLLAGEMTAPPGYVFRSPGGNLLTRLPALVRPGGQIPMPALSFVLRHPSAGAILVDTGLHPDAHDDLRRDFGVPLSMLFRTLRPVGEPFDGQLRGHGIDPGKVELVVMTHLHVDHTGGMRLLPRAEFACDRREWAAATGPVPVRGGYASGHLPDESRTRLLDFERDGEPDGPFARTIDLLGDGSIRLVSTPGHTRGHLSVLVRLADGGEVLLVGDAAYTTRSIREELLPMLTVGDDRYRRSLRELKAYMDARPEATVVPFHDDTAWRALVQDSPAAARTP